MLLWVTFALLTIAASAIVAWPLLGKRLARIAPDDELDRRLAVFRDRRDEIAREQTAGRLSAEEAEQARNDLLRQMSEELPPDAMATVDRPAAVQQPSSASRVPLLAGIAVLVLLPLLALGIYRGVGSPEIALAQLEGTLDEFASRPHAQFGEMVAELEGRLKSNPKDGEAWAVLAEAYKMVGNHGAAIEAYEKAIELLPPSGRLLADYAESSALLAGGDFRGRPTELLERALRADPNDQKAIALMAAARYHAGDLPQARRHLSQLLAMLPPESDEARQIGEVVTRIDADLAARGTPIAPEPPQASAAAAPSAPTAPQTAPSASTAPQAQGVTLRGTVALAPDLDGRVPAGATLFVVARPAEGSRVPVAVLRVPAVSLPFDFELSDANAMDPSRPLSSTDSIALEARLSASGDAMRRPGDLLAQAVTVRPGARDIAILIDRIVEP
jgi:cytochrome c-type biogenesis protein CcmH